uniref:Propionate--CoA ligase n=1 Tax=Scophthalmus maximus TaxID=52904 RepID=A0A8D3CY55_SCOMX
SAMVVPESRDKMYYPSGDLQRDAHVPDLDSYLELYRKSLENPEAFWQEVADEFFWKKPATGPMLQYNFDVTKGNIYVKCMEGAKTNICYNVLDRHVRERSLGEKVAYYWIPLQKDIRSSTAPPPFSSSSLSLCLSLIVQFAGFSSESLCERIIDTQSSVLVTADGVYRGEKLINLKQIVDEALEKCREKASSSVTKCLVVKHPALRTKSGAACNKLQTPWDSECDVWWDEAMRGSPEECEPEWLDAEDPLFILYTSGSTGKPKGVLHTVAGYMLYTSLTFKYVFDHHHGDVYWCTADIGWITGHSYITYGPLANGATSVLFEGVPVHPHVGRFWEIIEKYKVTKFYTAPTAIRLLMKYGREPLQKYDLSSLRIVGTVGEPINPEAWQWYHEAVGQGRCPVVDTFWQTETGGHVLTPLPAATPLKPGSATFPFFGVEPAILNEHGEELEGEAEGYLVFRRPWPGIMRTLYENHERFENTYFKKFPGFYVTGDGCRRDRDGYYWITGRIDDMLNVSGHLMSTAEVEAALTEHPAVAEAAVVSRPHEVKGECLYCFVSLKDCGEFNRAVVEELKGLGKIMRRILRQIARNDKDLGDLSTLADPKVVEVLFSQRCAAAS